MPLLSVGLARLAKDGKKAREAADSSVATGLFIVPLLVLALSLKGTFDGIVHRGGTDVASTALTREAGWMPRNVHVDPALWSLKSKEPIHYPSLTNPSEDFFIP